MPFGYPNSLKTIGDHIRKKRIDLKLLQKEVARKIGVDETSVLNWEKNRNTPSLTYIPKIVEFLGYRPFDISTGTPGEKIICLRRILGLSQKELARSLGVDPGTLGDWEKDKTQPKKVLLEKLNVLFMSSASDAVRLEE